MSPALFAGPTCSPPMLVAHGEGRQGRGSRKVEAMCLRLMESNARVGDRDRAVQKVPEGMTDS